MNKEVPKNLLKADSMTELRDSLSAKGVKYVLASYVDMHGISKGKMVPIDHIDNMMAGSEMFTGAALDGIPQDISDEEVAAHPDPTSCSILPWQPDVAWFASDLWCEDKPFEPCSRNILKRVLAKAQDQGYYLQLGIESEFYVLSETDTGLEPISERDTLGKPCYDSHMTLHNLHWLDELVEAMNNMGWGVYSFDHEDGNGQFEIDSDFTDGLGMADRFILMRMLVNEIARKHGYFATWMPKPFGNRTGSGAHFNMSLTDETGENLFVDSDDTRRCGLSAMGYHFIGGILKHLPAICAVVSPTVNSYKRMVKQGSMSGSTWAPVFICYGNNNRTNTIRIPKSGNRVELRAADSSCNPYLASAMVLAAGLEGIEQKIDPGDPHRDNMYEKSREELDKLGIRELPRTLGEAVNAFAADPLTLEVFGEQMHNAWVEYKRNEWADYLNHVSDWEMDRYLRFF